jgi:hypothetical protein
MTMSNPVQSPASYVTLFAFASTGSDTVSRERRVDPAPRLPSEPNLSRQFGEKSPTDYTVYIPTKSRKQDVGPTYSNLNPARARKMA